MDLATLIDLATRFGNLGSAVGEQVRDLALCSTASDINDLIERGELNTNVLDYAVDYFRLARDLGDVEGSNDALEAIAAWRNERNASAEQTAAWTYESPFDRRDG